MRLYAAEDARIPATSLGRRVRLRGVLDVVIRTSRVIGPEFSGEQSVARTKKCIRDGKSSDPLDGVGRACSYSPPQLHKGMGIVQLG